MIRQVLGWFLIGAAAVFCAANSVILSRGAMRWADAGLDKTMYGVIAGSVPWIIAVAPLVIVYAWRTKHRTWAVAGSVLYAVFIAYNVLGSAGALAMVRTDAVSARKFDASRNKDRATQRAALVKQREDIPGVRPPAMVEGLLQIERAKAHWGFSDECRELHNNAVRRFCSGYAKLRAELGAGRTREKLTADIAALDAQAGSAGWVADVVDPHAETISAATGIPVETVQRLLPLSTPLVLELGALVLGGLGFTVLGFGHGTLLTREGVPASASRSGEARVSAGTSHALPALPPPANPRPRMQRELAEWFFRECTRPVQSGVMEEDKWYAAYVGICKQSQDVPLSIEDFRALAAKFVPSMQIVDGRYFYGGMLPLVPKESAA